MTKDTNSTPVTSLKLELTNKISNVESYMHSLLNELEDHAKKELDELRIEAVALIAKLKDNL